MDSERWKRVDDLLQAALARPPGERAEFLQQACGGDEALEREVQSLLSSEQQAGGFLLSPAIEVAAGAMARKQDPDTDTGSSLTGQTISHYRILEKLGAGGMGVVWKARDTRLDRFVALKFLPAAEMSDPERKRRFVQEAKSASALNHPNIITIYDIGQAGPEGGTADFIAMELVPGKTLGQLIRRKGMRLNEALQYAAQVADALAAAHAAGIVHRDLKPGNVMVDDNGRVKLLDFGLAKLTEKTEHDPEGATATMGTEDGPQTEEGSIIGTAAYMSPEQAEGKRVDARSDIFSFGSVLYEMVTGRRAFEGASKISTLSAILHKEPVPASQLVANLPAELEKIIVRCLRKDPDRRAQNMADIKLGLEEVKEDSESGKRSAEVAAAVRPLAHSPRRLVAITAGVIALVVAAVGIAWWLLKRPSSVPARSEWVQLTNLPDAAVQPALSPDGRMLTFIRGPESFVTAGQVYVKMLPSGEPVQLTHDNRPKLNPVFSPDGSRIAYSVAGPIWDTWAVPVLGGEPRLWLPNASGLVWIDKSQLLFSEIKDQALHMAIVTADESRAGSRDLYMPPHERGMAHRSYPSPDGKRMLLVEMDEWGALVRCRLLPLDGSSAGQQVGPPNGACRFAAWSPDGEWMYFSSDSGGAFHIWRQRFPDGQPEQITSGPTEEEGLAMAPDGRSFITSVGLRQSSIWLHDGGGDRPISLEGYAFRPKFTPDGKRLLYLVRKPGSSELWVAELDSGRSEPLLPGFAVAKARPGSQGGYDISPDGRQVVVASPDSGGKSRLWLAPLDRRSPPRQIPNIEGEQPVFGATGEVFFRRVEGTSAFLYRVQQDGGEPRKALDLSLVALMGESPDRKWLALGSLASGGLVIFPVDGGTPLLTQISPVNLIGWSGDGKLFVVRSATNNVGKAYVLPSASGHLVPESIVHGLPPEQEILKLPGARVIPSNDVVLGPTADIYAFTRESVQSNLYRVPLP
jgi:Tol biopolymer transport system component